jgi:hypothetical protein
MTERERERERESETYDQETNSLKDVASKSKRRTNYSCYDKQMAVMHTAIVSLKNVHVFKFKSEHTLPVSKLVF